MFVIEIENRHFLYSKQCSIIHFEDYPELTLLVQYSVNIHVLQYEKPTEANLGDLSCDHNISLKLKSPHGESYNVVFNSSTFSFFEL